LARYKLTAPFWDGVHYHVKDSIVEWAGAPNLYMLPIDAEARAAKAEIQNARLAGRDPRERGAGYSMAQNARERKGTQYE
jgi:hypothetical protein